MTNSKIALNADIDTKAYMKAMKVIRKDALPGAVADTLNGTADAVTKQQIRNVKSDFIIRTKFTINSMQRKGKAINHARGKNVDRMFSRAGTFSAYLWKQEDDNEIEGMNGPKPIPTLAARTSKNLRKAVRKKYRLRESQSLQPGNFGQNQFIGKPSEGRRYGIYERYGKGKLRMIRNLESDSVKIKGKHFHSRAVRKYGTAQFIKAQFAKQAKKRLKRKGVI